MLIDFTVENYRSYREAKTFSLLASSSQEHPQNLIEIPSLGKSAVRVAAIYGANASGKSNLLEAMNTLGNLVTPPMHRYFADPQDPQPFGLDDDSGARPTRFAIRFVLDGQLFDYRLAVRPGLIEEERLSTYPNGRQQEWFDRTTGGITFNKTYLKGPKETLKSLTSESTPLLAVAASFGHPQLGPPAMWLGNNFYTRSHSIDWRARGNRSLESFGRLCATNEKFRNWVNLFLRHADLGIRGVEILPKEVKGKRARRQVDDQGSFTSIMEDYVDKRYDIEFIHTGAGGFTARLPISSESNGTRRLLTLLESFYGVLQGKSAHVVIIDEFGESMHPSLSREIVRVFQDPELNPHGSQLIFSTHDTSLLSAKLFRRDQVWFTEKNKSGATDLYSLHDFAESREGEAFEKGYLRGRYGAIPFFSAFDFEPSKQGEEANTAGT